MIFKIFLPKTIAKKVAFFTQNKAKLCKILIITLIFEKRPFCCQKLAKIAENYDHNIDPRPLTKPKCYLQRPTSGASLLCTKQLRKVEPSFALSCWPTAPIPFSRTRRARYYKIPSKLLLERKSS
jgi:hypothetical protein